ncbi:unnamed protein product, partial [Choristocarpus tenellus]
VPKGLPIKETGSGQSIPLAPLSARSTSSMRIGETSSRCSSFGGGEETDTSRGNSWGQGSTPGYYTPFESPSQCGGGGGRGRGGGDEKGCSSGEFDAGDECDDIFASLDLEQVISEHQKRQQMQTNKQSNISPPHTAPHTADWRAGSGTAQRKNIEELELEVSNKMQRIMELQHQGNQALAGGYELPGRLTEERQTLERDIPLLQKQLNSMKSSNDPPSANQNCNTTAARSTPGPHQVGSGGQSGVSRGSVGSGHTFVMRTSPVESRDTWGDPPHSPYHPLQGNRPSLGGSVGQSECGGGGSNMGGFNYGDRVLGGSGGGGGGREETKRGMIRRSSLPGNEGQYSTGYIVGGQGTEGGTTWGISTGGSGGGGDEYDNAFDMIDGGGNGGDGPVCEHGFACVKLTSRTEENFGREFYKCSLPKDSGDQCEFFEWVDGSK